MKLTLPPAAVSLLAALCLTAQAQAGVLDWILPKHDVQVIAVTDTTPAAALRRSPTPNNPVYYIAVNAGYRDFGGIIGGDKLPTKEKMFTAIVKVLSKQNYLPATKAHPPSVILLWTWGTMYTETMPSFNPDLPDQQTNHQQLLRFLGGYKLGMMSKDPGFDDQAFMAGTLFRTADMDMIDELAREDLYVAAIAAYDFAAAQRKEKVLLWTTKMSCPAIGLTMADTLPTMLALAGPYIGRETAVPVSISATDHFKPDIKIGDAKVVEYLEKTPVPIVDAEKQKLNKPGKKK